MESNEKKALAVFERKLKKQLEVISKDVAAYRQRYRSEEDDELVVRISITVDSDGYINVDIKDSDRKGYSYFSRWYRFAGTAWKKGDLASGTYTKVV